MTANAHPCVGCKIISKLTCSVHTPDSVSTQKKSGTEAPLSMSCEDQLKRHLLLNRFVPIGAVQQDQAGGAHVQADLRITALVNPGARAQPLTRHLQSEPLWTYFSTTATRPFQQLTRTHSVCSPERVLRLTATESSRPAAPQRS